jgi:TPR repeat protein
MNASHVSNEKQRFARRLKEARIGDPFAQYEVALMYATGMGVEKNVAQAFAWTKAAAEKGHNASQYLLGSAYAAGVGTNKDEEKALSWFLKAHEHGNEKASLRLAKVLALGQPALAFQLAMVSAERGFSEAQMMVADCYARALGVPRDNAHAVVWYLRAAEQGVAAAQYALGRAYAFGSGIAEDQDLAKRWYREAASGGHPAAQLALDRMDSEGLGRRGKNSKSRIGTRERRTLDTRWTRYAVQGSAEDYYHLGKMYELGSGVERSLKQARAWYRKAAELGYTDAQFAVAREFEDMSEHVQAVAWYSKAANQGHVEAQVALGKLQSHGLGGAQDQISALTWFAKAAAQGSAQAQFSVVKILTGDTRATVSSAITKAAVGGHSEAQFAMGERYRLGLEVPQNWLEAYHWYGLAAEQGNAGAQCALAGCYYDGLGVKKDLVRAFVWYEKAAAHHLPQAQWKLGELYAIGLPGVGPDPKKATQLCKRAANAGFAPACATLGALFSRAKKYESAVQWWTKAAEKGDLEAFFNLGQAYRLGLGVAKDEGKAFEWMLRAAFGGVAAAQSRIGLAYATGEGAALDPIEAGKWFKLAALGGEKTAAANLERARKALSPAQQNEIDRRVKEWMISRENKT